jgi:cytochrome bd-type quinol oxidase subunit 1
VTNNKNESFIKQWEENRQKGFLHYAKVRVIWLSFSFVIMSLFFNITQGSFLGWERGESILAGIIMGLVCGIISSSIGWVTSEAKHREIKNNYYNNK